MQPGFVQAIGMSVRQNWEWTAMIGEMLKGFFTAETSPKQLMGPLGIAEVAGGAAQVSWAALFGTMAMISLNLGLLNLLPIPILDGGHLLYYLIELVKRRPLSERAMVMGQYVGLALLMGLMGLAFYNDILRLVSL